MTELRGSAYVSAISDAEETSAADQMIKPPRPVLSSLCGDDLESPKSKRPTGKRVCVCDPESLCGNKEASGHTQGVQNRETMTTVYCSKY